MKSSKLYMIAQRHEILFENLSVDEEEGLIRFDLVCGDVVERDLYIVVGEVTNTAEDVFIIDRGERHIKFMNIDPEEKEPIWWVTTDKLLYDFWRGRYHIYGLKDHFAFTKFKLLYVGISTKNDSFTRLLKNGHKNKDRILSNEQQLKPTARLTDEVYIFLYTVEPAIMEEMTIEELKIPENLDQIKTFADAEKAFVHVMNPKYNDEKYENYPRGKDGLVNERLTSYSYYVNEDVTFYTDTATIDGAFSKKIFSERKRRFDRISIEDGKVFIK